MSRNRKLARSTPPALLLITLSGAALAAPAPPARVDGCARPGLARRTGTESCWAQLTLDGAGPEPVRLCLSRALWLEWLDASGTRPLCGAWTGRWKSFAPARNEPGRREPKPLLLKFHPRSLPVSGKPSPGLGLQRRIERARESVDAWLSSHERTGALSMLVTGTRRPGGALELILLLGFVHVLNASGIHLYALARWWSWIFETLAARSGLSARAALRLSRVAAGASWTASWLAAGARPGMLRPWLVVLLRRGARLAGLRWRMGAPLVLALAVDLLAALARGDLLDNTGRWVYALANAGGLLSRSSVGLAVGSWVLAALLQAHHEGVVALATPVISGLTLPVYAVALYPSVLLSCVLRAANLGAWAEALAAFNGRVSDALLELVSGWTMGLGLLWTLSRPALAAGMALGLVATLWGGARARVALLGALIGAQLLLGLASTPAARPPGPLAATRVEQLDVGQGDAALVRDTTGGTGLIDAGGEKSLSHASWVKLLALRQITRLDWIALTHLDEDHAGGVRRLGALLPVGCVATSAAELATDRGRRLARRLDELGVPLRSWEAGCVPFDVLPPPAEGRPDKANARMSAVLVPLAFRGFYLSGGDADSDDEPRIGAWAADRAKQLGAPRILKISHHGSRTSTHPRLLELVRPTEAWISCGAGNPFGHPAMSVLRELGGKGVPVFRTDRHGALGSPN